MITNSTEKQRQPGGMPGADMALDLSAAQGGGGRLDLRGLAYDEQRAALSPGHSLRYPGPGREGLPAPSVAEVKAWEESKRKLDAEIAAVVPNDKNQQRVALMGAATAGDVYDGDPGFIARVNAVAARYVKRSPGSKKKADEARDDAQKKVRDDASDAAKAKAHRGSGGPVPVPEDTKEAETIAGDSAWARIIQAEEAARATELRGKFVKWSGKIMFGRAPGLSALKKLAREEKAVKQPGSNDARRQIHSLRARHHRAFAPKLKQIKDSFILAAEERLKFWYDSQPGTRANYSMRKLGPNAEGHVTVGQTGGLIKGKASLPVANSVVDFARELKARASLDINTYHPHSWGRYSLDLWPRIKHNAKGFYKRTELIAFYRAVEAAARAANVSWRGLYNDFEAAKKVNRELGQRRINFQWEHGPDPMVTHLHVDIMPNDP